MTAARPKTAPLSQSKKFFVPPKASASKKGRTGSTGGRKMPTGVAPSPEAEFTQTTLPPNTLHPTPLPGDPTRSPTTAPTPGLTAILTPNRKVSPTTTFTDDDKTSPPTSTSGANAAGVAVGSSSHDVSPVVIGAVLGGVVLLAMLAAAMWVYRLRYRRKGVQQKLVYEMSSMYAASSGGGCLPSVPRWTLAAAAPDTSISSTEGTTTTTTLKPFLSTPRPTLRGPAWQAGPVPEEALPPPTLTTILTPNHVHPTPPPTPAPVPSEGASLATPCTAPASRLPTAPGAVSSRAANSRL